VAPSSRNTWSTPSSDRTDSRRKKAHHLGSGGPLTTEGRITSSVIERVMWEPGSALAEEAQDDEIFILRCSTRYLYAPIRNWGIPAVESLLVAKARALPLGRLVQANVGHLGKQPLCQRAVCLRSQRGVPVVSSHPRVLLLCEIGADACGDQGGVPKLYGITLGCHAEQSEASQETVPTRAASGFSSSFASLRISAGGSDAASTPQLRSLWSLRMTLQRAITRTSGTRC
jgi:hypothetical protein